MAEFMLLSIPWADRMNNFMTSLGFMGKGMGGILAVILLITLLVVLIMKVEPMIAQKEEARRGKEAGKACAEGNLRAVKEIERSNHSFARRRSKRGLRRRIFSHFYTLLCILGIRCVRRVTDDGCLPHFGCGG
mgnify:CR=1 FL=1